MSISGSKRYSHSSLIFVSWADIIANEELGGFSWSTVKHNIFGFMKSREI